MQKFELPLRPVRSNSRIPTKEPSEIELSDNNSEDPTEEDEEQNEPLDSLWLKKLESFMERRKEETDEKKGREWIRAFFWYTAFGSLMSAILFIISSFNFRSSGGIYVIYNYYNGSTTGETEIGYTEPLTDLQRPIAWYVATWVGWGLTWIYPIFIFFQYALYLVGLMLVRWERGPIEERLAQQQKGKKRGEMFIISSIELVFVLTYMAFIFVDELSDWTNFFFKGEGSFRSLYMAHLSHHTLWLPHLYTSLAGLAHRQMDPKIGGHRIQVALLLFFRLLAVIGDMLQILIRISLLSAEGILIAHAIMVIVTFILTFRIFAFYCLNINFYVIRNDKRKLWTSLSIAIYVLFVAITEEVLLLSGANFGAFAPVLDALLLGMSEVDVLSFPWAIVIVAMAMLNVFGMYWSITFFALEYEKKKKEEEERKKKRQEKQQEKVALLADFADVENPVPAHVPAPHGQYSAPPPTPKVKRSSSPNRRKSISGKVCLLIACHLSENNITETLHHAYEAGFNPEHIYVCHNGGTDEPVDDTELKVKEFNENITRVTKRAGGVQYHWLPEGNKTISFYYCIMTFCEQYKYIMMIDDDVLLPPNLDVEGPVEAFEIDDDVKACAYSIRCPIDDQNTYFQNTLIRLQSLEYLLAGFFKLMQSNFGTAMSCHGAISLWKRDSVIQVFLEHDTVFHAEDLQMGIILHIMNKGYKIITNTVTPVDTKPPKSLFWEFDPAEKSLMNQRIQSWDLAAHRYFFKYLQLLLLFWTRPTFILKPFLLNELVTILSDWFRFFAIVYLVVDQTSFFFKLFVAMVLFQYVIILIFDRVVLFRRPALQSPAFVLFIFPFYKGLLLIFRFVGLCFNLMFYTPWVPPATRLKIRKARETLPPRVLHHPDDIGACMPGSRRSYWFKYWNVKYWKNEEDLTEAQQDAKRDAKKNQDQKLDTLQIVCRKALVFGAVLFFETLLLIVVPVFFNFLYGEGLSTRGTYFIIGLVSSAVVMGIYFCLLIIFAGMYFFWYRAEQSDKDE